MEGKICPKCKTFKEKTDFYKSSSRLDRMSQYCKVCENEYKQKRYAERKELELYGII